MAGCQRILDDVREGSSPFARLDATQLVKHAFGLRTAVHHKKHFLGKLPALLYLYAEPERWPDGRPIPEPRSRRIASRSENSPTRWPATRSFFEPARTASCCLPGPPVPVR